MKIKIYIGMQIIEGDYHLEYDELVEIMVKGIISPLVDKDKKRRILVNFAKVDFIVVDDES